MATVFERISSIGSTIRQIWLPPKIEKQGETETPKVSLPSTIPYYTDTLSKAGEDLSQTSVEQQKVNKQQTTSTAIPSPNAYYVDTMAKATDDNDPTIVGVNKAVKKKEAAAPASSPSSTTDQTITKTSGPLPQIAVDLNEKEVTVYSERKKLEDRLQQLSAQVDAHLELEDKDFDKLQLMIYQVIMAIMRRDAKLDQHNMHELTVKIKKQAEEIKSTYNTWGSLTITVISAGISVGGGIAGLAPFFPASAMTPEVAAKLHGASQAIGTAGTGISGIGSIFNNRSEGTRQVLQIHLKRSQDLEEERKGSKQNKSQLMSSAKSAAEEFQRLRHEAHKTAAS